MAAAMGNQYALNNTGGRPLRFPTLDSLAVKIDDYFNTITITKPIFTSVMTGKDDEDNPIYASVPRLNNMGSQIMDTEYLEIPSILSMCLFMDINRDTLMEYSLKEEYSATIQKAKAKVEAYLADQLHRPTQVAGIIFNLKNNFGWKDVQTIENTGPNGGPLLIQAVSTMSDDDLKQMIEIMERSQITGDIVDIDPI